MDGDGRDEAVFAVAAGREEPGIGALPRWWTTPSWPWNAIPTLLARAWELRNSVSAHDAQYVALAELLDVPLVTGDERLSRAPGLRCAVDLLR